MAGAHAIGDPRGFSLGHRVRVKSKHARDRASRQQLVVRSLSGERDHRALERPPERERNSPGGRAGRNGPVSAPRTDQAGDALDPSL